ncbi:MAG: ABC transporter ATP-binding protein, partial [Parcubacteria group bacterium]|nr:ABC transporter ATP-binding protein [Parcubacteria group bacterium]
MFIDFKKIVSLYSLFRRAFGQYKWQLILLAFLSLISSVFEAIGLTALIPIFSIATDQTVIGADFFSNALNSIFTFFHIGLTLKRLLIFMVLLFLLKAVALFIAQYIQSVIVAEFERKTRKSLFKAVIKADWSYLSNQKMGYLDQGLTTDIERSAALFVKISNLAIIVVNIVVYTILVISISWVIAFITLILGVIIFFVFKPFFYRTRKIANITTAWFKEIAHYINEIVLGMKSVKSMFVEQSLILKA